MIHLGLILNILQMTFGLTFNIFSYLRFESHSQASYSQKNQEESSYILSNIR